MKCVIFTFSEAFVMLFYAITTYKFFFSLFLWFHALYNDSEAAEISDDNTNIDKMSEMSYKINLEIVNTSRDKKKIKAVENQVSEVITDWVHKVEESLTQKPKQKKRYRRYRTQERRKQRDTENHPLLSGCSSTCSKQCSKCFTEKVRSINITGICYQNRCKCNGCCKW